jgi:hypothetical protein
MMMIQAYAWRDRSKPRKDLVEGAVWKVEMDMRGLYYDKCYVGRSVVRMEGAWN